MMISTSPFFSSTEQNFSSNHEKCAQRPQIQSVIIITVDLLLRAFVVSVFVVKKTPLKLSLFCLPFEERMKGQTERNFFLSETNTNTGRNTQKKKKKKERKDDAREEAVVLAEMERLKLGPTEMWTWDWCCIVRIF